MRTFTICLFAVGCGISPMDAADELNHSLNDPEGWCGWKNPQPHLEDHDVQTINSDEIEKYAGYPSGEHSAGAYGRADKILRGSLEPIKRRSIS